jgi:hypothetical protein
MIGSVEFTEGTVRVHATLGNDGRWTCDGAPQVAELLDRECQPVGDPDEDAWGHDTLIKAALRLQGLAWLGPGPHPVSSIE